MSWPAAKQRACDERNIMGQTEEEFWSLVDSTEELDMPKSVRARRPVAGAKVAPKRKPIVPTVAQRNEVFDAIKKGIKELMSASDLVPVEFFNDKNTTVGILKIVDAALEAYEKARKNG